MNFRQKISVAITFLVIALVYVGFVTINPTADSYAYASDIKFDFNLFRAHHLLYEPFQFVLLAPLKSIINGNYLLAGQYLNVFFALASLLVLYVILKQLKVHWKQAILLVLLVAFSFGFWRFAVQNEPYILGLFFSLLGSLFLVKSIKNKHWVFFAGLMYAIAILIHQVQIFWYFSAFMAIAFYYKSFKKIAFFILPALIIPLVYGLVLVYVAQQEFSLQNLINFALKAYISGGAPIAFGWNNFFYFGVGIFRSFLEVFPTIPILLKMNWLNWLPFLVLIIWLVYSLWQFKSIFSKYIILNFNVIFITHLILVILLLLFSLFSMGNSEFLIGLPFALAILITTKYNISEKWLSMTIALFFIWNFIFGIYPASKYSYNNTKELVHWFHNQSSSKFLSEDNVMLEVYSYHYGVFENKNIINVASMDIQAIDSLVNSTDKVYTDIIQHSHKMTRGTLNGATIYEEMKQKYQFKKVDSFNNFYGKVYISEVSIK